MFSFFHSESKFLLHTHLEIAQQAVEYAEKYIKKSENMDCASEAEAKQIHEKIEKLRTLKLSEERALKVMFDLAYHRLEQYNRRYQMIEEAKLGVGNCGEFLAVIVHFCLENNVPFQIVKIDDEDHSFVVIGNDPMKNNQFFGPCAVVIDPWNRHRFLNIERFYPCTQDNLNKNLRHSFETPIKLIELPPLGSFTDQSKNILNIYNEKLQVLITALTKFAEPEIENILLEMQAEKQIKQNNESDLQLLQRLTKKLYFYLETGLSLASDNNRLKTLIIDEYFNMLIKEINLCINNNALRAIDNLYEIISFHFPDRFVKQFIQHSHSIPYLNKLIQHSIDNKDANVINHINLYLQNKGPTNFVKTTTPLKFMDVKAYSMRLTNKQTADKNLIDSWIPAKNLRG